MKRKKTVLFLAFASWLLLAVAWIMAFYTYPRLPQKIPLWLPFSGQQVVYFDKSPLFFIYPLAQTLFYIAFWLLSRFTFSRDLSKEKISFAKDGSGEKLLADLKKEFVYLALIFFNLIFIHLQRSIVLLAHRVEKGVDEFYFYTLFGILLLLIPYYRLRVKLIIRRKKYP